MLLSRAPVGSGKWADVNVITFVVSLNIVHQAEGAADWAQMKLNQSRDSSLPFPVAFHENGSCQL